MEYIHTCYRVLDLDRSIDFYTNKLGLELARKTPIGDDATNAFLVGGLEPPAQRATYDQAMSRTSAALAIST